MKKYAVYKIKNDCNKIIYIGFSGSAMLRAANHIDNQKWQHEMSSMDFEFFDTKIDAECSEILAIKRYRPKYNVTYNNDEPVRRAVDRHIKRVVREAQKFMKSASFSPPWGWQFMDEIEKLEYENRWHEERSIKADEILANSESALRWKKWCQESQP